MTAARLSCCVPFCRRTTGRKHSEWICGKHWQCVPLATRAAFSAERRKARKAITRNPLVCEYWKMPPGSPERLEAVAMWRALDAAWEVCRRAAIERAVGV